MDVCAERFRYSLREGFRFRPYACHCTDCQTRTGAAFSEHMLFARLGTSKSQGELGQRII